MFNLLRRLPPKRLPIVPPGHRIYVIGDIHGRADLLRAVHGQISEDAAIEGRAVINHLVYLGDYVDRGLDSKDVIDQLLYETPKHCRPVYLKGNHEAAMLDFLQGSSDGLNWLKVGGRSTLMSYGVNVDDGTPDPDTMDSIRKALATKLPAAHHEFLENLSLMIEIGDYFLVHAGVRPGVPLHAQDEHDLLWIRHPFVDSQQNHGKIVVHGHSIQEEPEVRKNRIGIDTGAYATGRLTCLVLENDSYRFLGT